MSDDAAKTWTTEYDEDAHVVVSTLWGRMSDKELLAGAADRIRLGNEKGTSNFILDVSRFVASDRSTFESVFEIVTRSYPEMNATPEARIAFIPALDPDTHWFVGFFQNLCDSRGWVLHEVSDHEAAYAWLNAAHEGATE